MTVGKFIQEVNIERFGEKAENGPGRRGDSV